MVPFSQISGAASINFHDFSMTGGIQRRPSMQNGASQSLVRNFSIRRFIINKLPYDHHTLHADESIYPSTPKSPTRGRKKKDTVKTIVQKETKPFL